MPDSLNSESVRPKRSRKDRPCDHCRRLKHTCNITVRGSRCANCVKGNRDCTFTGPSVARHVPRTEPLLPWPDELPVAESPPAASSAGLLDAVLEIDGESDTADLELEPFFRDLDQDLQDEEESHYLGSGFFSRDQLEGVEVSPAYRQVADPGRPVYFIRNPSRIYGYANSDFEAQRAYNAATSLILQFGPLLPTELTERFTNYVLPAFPIMNAVRLEAACKGWQGGGQFPYAVLVGVFAFMSPSVPSLRPVCKDLWSFAVQLLDNEYRRPRLHTLQLALLDICGRPVLNSGGNHIAIGRVCMDLATVLTTQANGLAQLLGLHRDSSRWHLPKWERSLRKRIWWTLYIQDRWNALIYDRPIQLDGTSPDVQPVMPNDDDWGGQKPESRLHVFSLSCRLAVIVDKLLPITQTFGSSMISSVALHDLSRRMDQMDGDLRALPMGSPGLAALQLSILGLNSLMCRITAGSDPRELASQSYYRRARRALKPVIRNIERIIEVIGRFGNSDLEGYWPIWTSPLIVMSISTALHLITRIWRQSSGQEMPSTAQIRFDREFDTISSLVCKLQEHASLASVQDGTDLQVRGPTRYWEVAESVLARLPTILRSLPEVPGSDGLRNLVANSSAPRLEDTDLALDPFIWFNWITLPEDNFTEMQMS